MEQNSNPLDNKTLAQLDELELKHRKQVIDSFLNYTKDTKVQFHQLYEQTKLNSYFQILKTEKRQKLEQALEKNQQFLNRILEAIGQQQQSNETPQIPQTKCINISKMRSTIKQFYRQWCSQSKQQNDYKLLLSKVEQYVEKGKKVLVPGCGLGRLVLDFVEAGFGAQGNQVTYFMLFCSNFILNVAQRKQEFEIYPFIHNITAYEDHDDAFRSVKIPDKAAFQIVKEGSDFSMIAGEFTQLYSKPQAVESFDCVTTCFFIDTANNIFDYVDTIFNVLKQNAVWINYGPLLYHYRQVLDQVSIQISWECLKKYIESRFQFLEQKIVQTTYCHDQKSTYTAVYKCILFAAKKKPKIE